jgi:hypothetical protein
MASVPGRIIVFGAGVVIPKRNMMHSASNTDTSTDTGARIIEPQKIHQAGAAHIFCMAVFDNIIIKGYKSIGSYPFHTSMRCLNQLFIITHVIYDFLKNMRLE